MNSIVTADTGGIQECGVRRAFSSRLTEGGGGVDDVSVRTKKEIIGVWRVAAYPEYLYKVVELSEPAIF